jgi:hypothetical protein
MSPIVFPPDFNEFKPLFYSMPKNHNKNIRVALVRHLELDDRVVADEPLDLIPDDPVLVVYHPKVRSVPGLVCQPELFRLEVPA